MFQQNINLTIESGMVKDKEFDHNLNQIPRTKFLTSCKSSKTHDHKEHKSCCKNLNQYITKNTFSNLQRLWT